MKMLYQLCRSLFVCAIGWLVTACTEFESQVPGIYFDVHFTAPPPSTLYLEFARDVAARTNFKPLGYSTPIFRPDTCSTALNQGDPPLRQVTIITDTVRNNLFVDLREFGAFGPKTPSAETRHLGETLEQIIHERFPAAEVTPGRRISGLFAP